MTARSVVVSFAKVPEDERLTLMLGGGLNASLSWVREQTAGWTGQWAVSYMNESSLTKTKKELTTDDPCMIGAVCASPESDEDTKGCHEEQGTRDNERLEASHIYDDRSESSSR